MGALSAILRNSQDGGLHFYCPGCKHAHGIRVGEGPGPRWGWNGNAEKPTFTPSVLVWWDEPANIDNPEALQRDLDEARRRRDAGEQNVKIPVAAKRCHSFVTDGRIQFLGDCTHALAGQTVDLPAWPGGYGAPA